MKKSASTWLRYICNLWTIVSLGIVVADFLKSNSLESVLGPTLAIYIGVLVVYSAQKEFERWAEYYKGRHPGELYVIAWTVLIAVLLVASLFVERDYHLPEEVVATYIGVISIMAFTNKSKSFFNRRRK
jgi:hypothetical protein